MVTGIAVRIEEHLKEKMREHGGRTTRYFKAKHIAQDLGLSTKEVGANMGVLSADEDRSLKIEKWGYSKSTTWKVTWR